MQLTGEQIVKRKIVYNVSNEGIQQQGVDVRVAKVFSVEGGGIVPEKGKTTLPTYKEVEPKPIKFQPGVEYMYFHLTPGWYELELMEGCNIGSKEVLNFKTRSSLVRCGAVVHSGQFDAGFTTEKMGCFLHVMNPINIQLGARVAQAIVNESYEVGSDNLYNGQWQGDKQRT